jgi:hypothetical protein
VSAAGRALYLIDHPHCHPTTWDAVNEQTRAWWDARAQPVAIKAVMDATTTNGTNMCEAEARNKRALYLLENEWGCGRIDIGQLQRILRGDEPDTCKEPA